MARTARKPTKTKATTRTARPRAQRAALGSAKAASGRGRPAPSAVLEEPRRAARGVAARSPLRTPPKRRPVLQGVEKRRPAPMAVAEAGGPGPVSSGPASEEERIESAKYLPRTAPPKRLFEEERFLFPETYGTNRVRLLVKDPEWLFAHWDVDQRSLSTLRKEVGERAVVLARLTLRVADPGHGGSSVILLPPGVRGWYVRADKAPRSYRAELGLTLPSGEFRSLATSNTVTTPRVGPSRARAHRRVDYRAGADAASAAGTPVRGGARPGPLPASRMNGAEDLGGSPDPGRKGARKGGASDVYRR
jgi:hypothetical protein